MSTDVRLAALLAEYQANKAEMASRSNFQHAIVALNLTASSTVAGVVLAGSVDKTFLLVLTVMSSSLGLIWFDHGQGIYVLGDYLRNELWPAIEELAGGEALPLSERQKSWRVADRQFRIPFALAYLVIFGGVSLFGFILAASIDTWWLATLTTLSAGMTLAMFHQWWQFYQLLRGRA